jgi:hypothetical protein
MTGLYSIFLTLSYDSVDIFGGLRPISRSMHSVYALDMNNS